MFVLPRRLVVGDFSVIHPAAASFAGGAACTPGFAAAARDASKRLAYWQVSSALPFVPMLVESFGRLGVPSLTLLGDLADQAVQAGEPGLSRAAVNSEALRELSLDRDLRSDNDFIWQLEIHQGISHQFIVA
jgi:hypothetical protein